MKKKVAVIVTALVMAFAMFGAEAAPVFVDDAEAGRCNCKNRLWD